jgi:CubicO group peptidase (beta-lactamase class C family)
MVAQHASDAGSSRTRALGRIGRMSRSTSHPPRLLPLPAQPEGVAWPTREWPRAALDARVDRAALEGLLDHACSGSEPEDLERTHAVVIAQHGAIVAERYGEGAGPNDAFRSWSIAKSITNALIGILVRQGRLDIAKPIPVM